MSSRVCEIQVEVFFLRWMNFKTYTQVLCGRWLGRCCTPSTSWWSRDEWIGRISLISPCSLVRKCSVCWMVWKLVGTITDRSFLLSGFVGLFNLLLLWPGFLLLHYTGFEAFELPSQLVWTYILINGLIGTVLSEFLWLWWAPKPWHVQTSNVI